MNIYLIRHTTPKVEQGTCYGQTDLDVEENFEQEVQLISRYIPDFNQIKYYSSPLKRCLKLAEKLNKDNLVVDARLKELNFGDWEMKKWQEIEENEFTNWRRNFIQQPTPNGEAHIHLHHRATEFWKELTEKTYTQVGIVTHYGILQALLAHLLHIPLEKSFRLDLAYGAVIRVILQGENFCKIKFIK